ICFHRITSRGYAHQIPPGFLQQPIDFGLSAKKFYLPNMTERNPGYRSLRSLYPWAKSVRLQVFLLL
ncbi:MAG: hypothetical protein LUH22_06865, partial [Bacteroides sp.]|nr:hypothetical protein [Bacteroides sp.]